LVARSKNSRIDVAVLGLEVHILGNPSIPGRRAKPGVTGENTTKGCVILGRKNGQTSRGKRAGNLPGKKEFGGKTRRYLPAKA